MTAAIAAEVGGDAGVAWLAAGAVAALKATAILLLATGAARVLRGRSAALRHLVWTAALAAALALPALDAAMPSDAAVSSVTVPVAWSADAGRSSGVPVPVADGAAQDARAPRARPAPGAAAEASPGVAAGARGSDEAGWTSWAGWLVVISWAAGALFVLARTLWGSVSLARVRRRAEPLSDPYWLRRARQAAGESGGRATPAVRVSPEVSVPLTCGLVRTTLLLPQEALDEWPRERTEAVLLHELAHLRRRDTATHLLGRLACATYWFHPLVWRAAGEAARERERACDDAVLRAGVKASAYARHLLDIARGGRPGSPAGATTVSVARRSDLEDRVLAVLERDTDRRPVSGVLSAGALLPVVGATLALAAVSVEADIAGPVAPETRAPAAAAEPVRSVGGATRPADVASPLLALLDDPDPAVRSAAAEATGRLGLEAATGRLTEALDDPSPKVRRAAAGALAEIEDPSAVGALRRVLLSDASVRVRKAAAWALGETESHEAVHALEEALDRVGNRWVRKKIARALGETRQPAAVPVLSELLRRPGRKVRAAALEGLVENGTDPARTALSAALESDDPEIRALAARALGRDG